MTRDREAALRDLLTAIHGALEPATPDRVGAVRVLLKGLVDGPLDNVAVQGATRMLPVVLRDLAPAPLPEVSAPAVGDRHQCPTPGCGRRVPYHQLMCRSHWYAVPKHLRDAVWAAWRLGAGADSDEHTEAIEAAIASLAPQPAGHLCGRCGNPVAKPGMTLADGRPAARALFCDACVDRCHENSEFDHICQVCATPDEARARGWAVAR